MIRLGPGEKPIIRSRYPHFLAEDIDVWTRFLKQDAQRIIECWYDVRVGQQVLVDGVDGDLTHRISLALTRKRIDVIARVEGGVWVVEVKPYANMYAVGQVLTYVRLFGAEFKVEGELTPVLVCDSYDEDLVDEFDEFGILVVKND